ncbi:hypothetical protein DZE40_000730 [Clostridium beijerinckii]|uniref:Uncharacterized protein n=1 Tax=Clostridium beijerinckii TaxID=1520 RepID=A0A1S8SB98_CLOBE|nr:hypothetical protein [Clostridium beijerinckii]OOM62758.1 hypothetical protein CLBCK_15270 [Clostridium beijerinckii]
MLIAPIPYYFFDKKYSNAPPNDLMIYYITEPFTP